MGVTLRFERTGNKQIDQFQRELNVGLAALLASPFATGKALRNNSLSAGVPKTILHGLGQIPANVIPLLVVAASFTAPVVISLTATSMVVESGSNCVVDFWVS